jgi:hypothetical protein
VPSPAESLYWVNGEVRSTYCGLRDPLAAPSNREQSILDHAGLRARVRELEAANTRLQERVRALVEHHKEHEKAQDA